MLQCLQLLSLLELLCYIAPGEDKLVVAKPTAAVSAGVVIVPDPLLL